MTMVESGARHRRTDYDRLDAPRVPILINPQGRHNEQTAPKTRSRGRKLVRRVLLASAAGFGVLMVLGIVGAIVSGPTPVPATAVAPAPLPSAPPP